jgi:3-oxoacyl-[acyl-carrier protein] reductase
MMLENKIAVVYGAGSVGTAVAKAFAAEGAQVFLASRTAAKLEAAAKRIPGGKVETAILDALDAAAVQAHVDSIVAKTGRLDVSFNAVSFRGDLQGKYLRDMPIDDFLTPIEVGSRAHFLTATAAARQMAKQRSGSIVTLSTTAAGLSGRDRSGFHQPAGFGVACAAIEELTRTLAGELGPLGVRVNCIRSDAISEVWPPEHEAQWRSAIDWMEDATALKRLPKLVEVANAVMFAASDRSSGMTGALVNLSCGSQMFA